MAYKFKRVLEQVEFARRATNQIVMYVGFMFMFILAILSYVYLSGVSIGEAGQLDLTSIITRLDGKIGYVFIGVVIVFLVASGIPYVLRFRNWWVHTESHKITRETYLYISGGTK